MEPRRSRSRRKWHANARPDNWGGDDVARDKYKAADRGTARRDEQDKPNTGFNTLRKLAEKGGMPEDRIPPSKDFDFAAAPEIIAADQEPEAVKILDMAETLAIPTPKPIIPGLLYQHENVALVAVLKSGKTFVALDLALSVASGTPVFGNTDGLVAENVGAVVFMSGEGHAGIPSRIKAWLGARGREPAAVPLYYIMGVPKAKEGLRESQKHVAAVRARLGGHGAILVVVDTLARSISGLDENETATASVYHEMTEYFVKHLDCAVLTIAHASNKNQEKWGREHEPDFRGSSAFGAGFDATWTR